VAANQSETLAGRQWAQRGFLGFFALVAAIGLLGVRGFSLGTLSDPGPAVFPLLVFSLLLVMSLGVIIWPARAKAVAAESDSSTAGAHGQWRVVVALMAAFGYAVILPWVGDLVAGFVVFCAVGLTLRARNWPVIVVAGAILCILVHLLFVIVLSVPLPQGFWPWSQ
jgi:hypothetical protein